MFHLTVQSQAGHSLDTGHLPEAESHQIVIPTSLLSSVFLPYLTALTPSTLIPPSPPMQMATTL